jgi:hypothetical protein
MRRLDRYRNVQAADGGKQREDDLEWVWVATNGILLYPERPLRRFVIDVRK